MTQPADPIERFQRIFSDAWEAKIKNAHAMTLSSVDEHGQPSSRQVLLKEVDERGFVFYTNLESRKGREILANPKVSLNFYWRELDKQVTIFGTAERVSDEQADAYFVSRDHDSRVGAWASQQSRPLESRARLQAEVAEVEAQYPDRDLPRPPYWAGLLVVPFYFDFWTSGAARLHDRIVYEREDDGWRNYRVYP